MNQNDTNLSITGTDFATSFLSHYGVKGMRWGIRKDDERAGYRMQAPKEILVEQGIHAATAEAGADVAALVGQRYGFEITDLKTIGPDHPEYAYGTIGFVQSTPGKRGGSIFVRADDQSEALKGAEEVGWFGKGCGHQHAFLTHEAAHAIFHAEQEVKQGFLGPKTVGGHGKARDAAFKVAMDEARKEGLSTGQLLASKVSGYSAASMMREELEAEMFSQYHWGTNPPQFVKAWGESLHREMGIDATPFREVTKRG